MSDDFTAVASTKIDAPAEVVWDALLNPEAIRQFMFGANVSSDWHEGHAISWKGTWQGKPYEDKGVVLKVKPLRLLQYSHFSPLSGKPDRPENYHHVTIELTPDRDQQTVVSITQDKNETREARVHSEKTWASMLASLKKLLDTERGSHVPAS